MGLDLRKFKSKNLALQTIEKHNDEQFFDTLTEKRA